MNYLIGYSAHYKLMLWCSVDLYIFLQQTFLAVTAVHDMKIVNTTQINKLVNIILYMLTMYLIYKMHKQKVAYVNTFQ